MEFGETTNLKRDIEETKKRMNQKATRLRVITEKNRGCNMQALVHTYKSYKRPLSDHRAMLLATTDPKDRKKTEYLRKFTAG